MRYPALGVIVLASLAGCGGSDSEGGDSRRSAPSSGAQRTSDEFVRRVDAICKDTYPELAQTRAALTKARDAARAGQASLPETFDTFATLLRKARATTQRLRTRMRAVEVPRRERAFHGALMDSIDRGSSNLDQQVSAAEAGDAVKLRDLSIEGSTISAKGKGVIAGHGGFRFCGRR